MKRRIALAAAEEAEPRGLVRLLCLQPRRSRPDPANLASGDVPVAVGLAVPQDMETLRRMPSPISRESRSRGTDVRLFGPFRLDVGEQRLWRGNDELKLRRKPFAILRFLTENPLRLATQEEVVEAVWGKIAMSESLLRTHMSEVRRVLGEGAIETVVGRGYRFLLEVEAEKPATHQPKHVEALPIAANLVGRSGEMDVLQEVFDPRWLIAVWKRYLV